MRVKLGTGYNNESVTIELNGYGEITLTEIKSDVLEISEINGKAFSVDLKAQNKFALNVLA